MKKKKKKATTHISKAAATATKAGKPAHLLTYTITYNPLPSKDDKLPRQIKSQLDDLYKLVHSNPRLAIAELLQLKEAYPEVPLIYNYLASAYGQTGNRKASRDIIIENYAKNPDYLFAKINYAQVCLLDGEPSKIPEIFEGKFDLKLLYPNRSIFHVDEFAGFSGVMCAYYSLIGQRETAELLFKALKEVAPDSNMVRFAKSYLEPSLFDRIRRWGTNESQRVDAKIAQELAKQLEEHLRKDGTSNFEA